MVVDLSPYHIDDRLFFIGIALLLNWLIASRSLRRVTGVAALGLFLRRLLQRLDHKLNRTGRSGGERGVRGFVVLLVSIALCGLVAASLSALTAIHPWTWLAEAAIIALFIPQRQTMEEMRAALRDLRADDLTKARQTVSRFAVRDTHTLDRHALTRAGAEHGCSSLALHILTPLLWYALLGLPGFVAARIIIADAAIVGYDSTRYRDFGRPVRAMEAFISWLPERMAGWLVIAASFFVPKARPLQAVKAYANQQNRLSNPLKTGPVAACAGALGISLGGPRSVHSQRIKDGWVGTGSAKVELTILRQAMWIYAISCLLILALIATLLSIL